MHADIAFDMLVTERILTEEVMRKRTPKGTAINERRKIVLAAVMGFTNTGQDNPSRCDVERLFKARDVSVESCIFQLAASICESDEMLETFTEEAKWWYTDCLRGHTEEDVARIWPDMAKLLDGLGTEVTA